MRPPLIRKRFFKVCLLGTACFLLSYCGTSRKQADAMQWEKLGPGGGGSTFIPAFSYHSPDNFLVRCDMTGAYLTSDGGKSYDQINFENGSSCFAYDQNDLATIYIGSAGMNRSNDGGKTFEQIFPKKNDIETERFLGDHAEYEIKTKESSLYVNEVGKIESIGVDPVSSNSLYFTMGSFFFYSIDSGHSWKRENLNQKIEYLYTNKTSLKNEVYVFSKDAIFIFNKSSHQVSKRDIPQAMLPATSFAAGIILNTANTIFYALHHLTPKENAYAFTNSEIWTSEDLGLSWKPVTDATITNEKSGTKPCFTMLVCSENDAANAYVVTNKYEIKTGLKTQDWYGALKTNDAGKSWNWVWKGGGGSGQYGVQDARDATNLQDAWAHNAFGGEFIQLLDVGVSPQNGNIAIVTDWYRTMKTMDGGKTWNEIYSISNPDGSFTSRGMDVTTTYGVHFDPFEKNHIAISFTDIGLHQSYDGGKSWSRSVQGVPNDWVNTCYWMVFDPDVKGKVWSVWSGMHDFPRGKMTRNPQWKNADYAKGGVCISIDGGKTWKPTIEGMGMDSPSTCIILDPESKPGNRTLYTCVYNKGIFKSTDDGKTWALKNTGIEENTCAFELTLASNGNLFLITSATPMHKNGKKGRDIYSGAVYRSKDGAESWTKLNVTNGILFPNGIDFDPENPDCIYLGCWSAISLADQIGGDVANSSGSNPVLDMPGGIFKSEDGGNTWKSIFDQRQYVYDVTVDPYHKGRLYCNTFNKTAWRSDNNGKTWNRLKGYDFHWGHRIIIDENDHEKVYITTFGSSVWHGIPEVE